MPGLLGALLAIAALMSSGCGAGPLIRHSDLDCYRTEQSFLPVSLAGWKDGFDARGREDPGWRVGDRMLYGVELESEGERKSWLVHLEVERVTSRIEDTFQMPGDPARYAVYSHDLVVKIKTHDGAGELLSETAAEVRGEQLSIGLFGICSAVVAARPGQSPEQRETGIPQSLALQANLSVSTFRSLMQLLQENESLSPILGEVVQLPSILTLLFASKIRIRIAPLFHHVRETRHPLVEGSAFCLPVTLAINDEPAMLCQMLVGPPATPFRLGGGILNIEGTHPYDPSRRFTVRVLAARGGGQ